MTRAEQQQFYADTAAALSQGDRIAQLEAALADQYAALNDLLIAAGRDYAVRAHVERQRKHIRAALALAGASQGSGT